jgi:hypothetical protein
MKKLLILFIAGAVCMTGISGCSDQMRFERYSSKNPDLSLSMDYISGWRFSEHSGEKNSYDGVVFFENKKGDVPKALIGLTVRPGSNRQPPEPQSSALTN